MRVRVRARVRVRVWVRVWVWVWVRVRVRVLVPTLTCGVESDAQPPARRLRLEKPSYRPVALLGRLVSCVGY